jgi:putative DNA-invertase from lambdoid prophage Rac
LRTWPAAAEAQAEATRVMQKAGMAHAQATEPQRYRGLEADCDRAQLGIIRDLLAQDASPTATPEAAAVSRQVVYRVREDPAKAEAMLAEWGCRPRLSRHLTDTRRSLGSMIGGPGWT